MNSRRFHGLGRVSRVSLATLVVGLGLLVTPAHADMPTPAGTSNATEAENFKRRGDELFDASRHEDAIAFYTQSYALSPNPALLYNRGRSYEALGRNPEALMDLEQFSRTAPAEIRAKVPGIDKLIADVRARVAELEIACNVPGARLVVRDRVMGTLTGEVLRLNAGVARIELTAAGFYPFTTTVELKSNARARVDATLHRVSAEQGLLVLRGPKLARVSLDGKDLGQPPVERALTAGEHQVILRQDGFEDAHKVIVVAAGKRAEVDIAMRPTPPFYARAWFWGVAGAVAAGAVTAVVLANTSRPADSGTLGQVSGPLVRF